MRESHIFHQMPEGICFKTDEIIESSFRERMFYTVNSSRGIWDFDSLLLFVHQLPMDITFQMFTYHQRGGSHNHPYSG
jgi:hypothetical protein